MPGSRQVAVVTRRNEVAEAYRSADGSWETGITDPERVDVPSLAPRISLAVIDFAGFPAASATGRRLRRENPALEFIAVVPDERTGVAAVRAGALDYMIWPPRTPEQGRSLLQAHLESVNAQPQTLGRFQLNERLGIGGMAEVFLAERRGDTGRLFAVKRILPGVASDPDFIDMFIDEARITAVLDHPNIVRLIDFGNVSGTLFLAMEYVPGRNLSQLAGKRGWRLPVRIACHICAEIASALAYAHAKTDPAGRPLQIVHRDVNPPNILLAKDGRVLLGDFGIAKAAQRSAHTTHGAVKGKLDYLAPEQTVGLEVDGRADLFSLGTVLYLTLTGVQPFQSEGPALTLMKIRDAAIVPPTTVDPGLPPALDAIMARAMARDREKRYPDGAAFERDLRALLGQLGPVTREEIAALVDGGEAPVVSVAVEESGAGSSSAVDLRLLGEEIPAASAPPPVAPAPPAGGASVDRTAISLTPPPIPALDPTVPPAPPSRPPVSPALDAPTHRQAGPRAGAPEMPSAPRAAPPAPAAPAASAPSGSASARVSPAIDAPTHRQSGPALDAPPPAAPPVDAPTIPSRDAPNVVAARTRLSAPVPTGTPSEPYLIPIPGATPAPPASDATDSGSITVTAPTPYRVPKDWETSLEAHVPSSKPAAVSRAAPASAPVSAPASAPASVPASSAAATAPVTAQAAVSSPADRPSSSRHRPAPEPPGSAWRVLVLFIPLFAAALVAIAIGARHLAAHMSAHP